MAWVHSFHVGIGRTNRRLGLPLLRPAAAVIVLWLLWRHVGTTPFKDGLRAVAWPAVVAAVMLTALTMVCSAWRRRVAAQALGIGIGLPTAVRAYYRDTGVTIATLYGVLMLTAVAPGAGLLLGDAVRRRRDQGQSGESRRPDPAPRALEVVRD